MHEHLIKSTALILKYTFYMYHSTVSFFFFLIDKQVVLFMS